MTGIRTWGWLALAATGLTVTTAQAADANLARSLAATCATCHGSEGRSAGGMASLAGEPRERLLAKLQAYAAGVDSGTIMPQVAKGYSAAQLELIADWFAAQPPAQEQRDK